MKKNLIRSVIVTNLIMLGFGCASDDLSLKQEVQANIDRKGNYLGNKFDGTYQYEGPVTYVVTGPCADELHASTLDPSSKGYYVLDGNELTYPNMKIDDLVLVNEGGSMHPVDSTKTKGPVDSDGSVRMYGGATSDTTTISNEPRVYVKLSGNFIGQAGNMTLHASTIIDSCNADVTSCCRIATKNPIIFTRQ